ncbi:MAG: hypothetical protein IPI13_17410 [Actinomycetales bacterium]|jgi:hypothetical protein|uniref:Uncharacterized protein n=1 Tax=Candidatus Phosphoribacter hodrii TaxID=2953743 RepID=A0A935ITR3_9MICO|nr:hypothetical protein [Candidatus Phosphoribacter hodrii]HRC65574.1 hypothetical protein [Dermatophilaceae bacterium]
MSGDAVERIGIVAVLLGVASVSVAAFLVGVVLGLVVAGALALALGVTLVGWAHSATVEPTPEPTP